jgi:hypothetical protein
MHSTPQRFRRAVFGLLSAFRILLSSGRKAPPRCLNRPTEWLFWNPLWERPAGTHTHSRRTGRKLGRLRYARQGLVRVPESNTKYGGKSGITGVNAAPVIGPSISESKRIRQPKISPRRASEDVAHPMHRVGSYARPGLAVGRLKVRPRAGRGWHVRQCVAEGAGSGQAALPIP